MEKILKIKEVAEYFRVSVVTIRRWERMGKIKSISPKSHKRLFKMSDIEKLLK